MYAAERNVWRWQIIGIHGYQWLSTVNHYKLYSKNEKEPFVKKRTMV